MAGRPRLIQPPCRRTWCHTTHHVLPLLWLLLRLLLLLCVYCRLIMSNIFTYGWKAKVDPASMQAALRGLSSPDDAITWAAVLGCMGFYLAALGIERLGVVLLRREARVRGWCLSCG